ncbi:hypothetical protein K435DRAFT_860490 [Dendrothele bispora CBS 962.96]|uniref:Uncharacterized protein n=1 Tax=Dendrothele bispora (strain CBS 962.96) TaxID=1314807 RepID=A0A4S8LXV7_DENBC|nr:hypothetical protein K435DRAFT_860490 [Dendrothele bispora CBS 962.96]
MRYREALASQKETERKSDISIGKKQSSDNNVPQAEEDDPDKPIPPEYAFRGKVTKTTAGPKVNKPGARHTGTEKPDVKIEKQPSDNDATVQAELSKDEGESDTDKPKPPGYAPRGKITKPTSGGGKK